MKNTIIDIKKDFNSIVILKIKYFKQLLSETNINANIMKKNEVFNSSEFYACLSQIEKINSTINNIVLKEDLDQSEKDDILSKIQECNDSIYDLFKSYGTLKIENVLNVCFGKKYIHDELSNFDNMIKSKYDMLNSYCNVVGFKIIPWKKTKTSSPISQKSAYLHQKSSLIDDNRISDSFNSVECFDVARSENKFYSKVYGMKICFQNKEFKKSILIKCIIQNLIPLCIDSFFISYTLKDIFLNKPTGLAFENNDTFINFINSLSLKELCVYERQDIYDRFVGFINQTTLMKKNPISQLVKEFINSDLYSQRNTLIQLLIRNQEPEYYYIAYLLYDLLSNDEKNDDDVIEQSIIYDSLPWNIKQLFKNAMRTTINYTKQLVNIDKNKIPIEQQICLMKVSDSVKEKAMIKLRELKNKTEDTGSKARQYIDGLLKIPFGIYKEEPILRTVKNVLDLFKDIVYKYSSLNIEKKETYNTLEMINHINEINNTTIKYNFDKLKTSFVHYLNGQKRNFLIDITITTNDFLKKHHINRKKLLHSAKKNDYLIENLILFYNELLDISRDKLESYLTFINIPVQFLETFNIERSISIINKNWLSVKSSMSNVKDIMENAVYGHTNAKRQIERVIGQWMTGEQRGYCFGFEGPPGIGKTSIAKKGIAKCLVDENGKTRPFGFIAIGGSSNSSTLDGHNYTYVGSTWGRIIDILMESKCMNPIIFIDELDKISKTEQGKEIIGILTHLVDPTQNSEFHDKYFSGIDIDLSKVLFVFSYNDVNLIDKILLDRIHRIKFNNLSIDEKIIISNNYLLPEIYQHINLKDTVEIDDNILRYIIEKYTCESGVRKLKEILFEIISEINLELLNNNSLDSSLNKIILTEDILKNKYLKDRCESKPKKIHDIDEVGIINGLWANSIGQGGIIPIQTTFFPTKKFLELKLTGMQGDVMKESMEVAKTLAFSLTSDKNKSKINKNISNNNLGIHIHCPEGSVPKDGPSAGTAITVTIYSLINNLKIKHNIGITGEINLQGHITAIGGLDLKILGGVKAGVKEFVFPKENNDDFIKIKEKYGEKELKGIKFHEVDHISEVLKLVFV